MIISNGVTKDPKTESIKDGVLKAIADGRVRMRPKWQFITKTVLLIVGAALLTLTVLYLVSLIEFVLRRTGVWFVPYFGPSGYGIFFMSLPWVLILLAAIFMLLLEILVKRYSFAYARPFLYSALAVIFLGIIGGIIIGETPLHERFFDEAENGQLPFAGPIYEYFGQRPSNVTIGEITQINSNGYQISLFGDADDSFAVIVGQQTQAPPPNSLKVGDVIVILGPRRGSVITALGIQKPSSPPSSRRRLVVPAPDQ